jgi:molybdopterin converting factor small subunit
MSVKVRVFYPELQRLVDNPDEIRVEGETVGECLDDLVRQYPGVRELIFDTRGELFKRFYVYVNAESMYKAEFARAVGDKDELILAVLATGG